jgi:hypothetical protein
MGSPIAGSGHVAVQNKYKAKDIMGMMVVRDKRVWERKISKNFLI